jgi:thioredoxin reductase (NADPH)
MTTREPHAGGESPYDAIVVGGGPAGLSAALSLARFDRLTLLLDAGRGRSTWHQVNHNYLGFPGGIRATDLRDLGRRQLADYPQVTVREHTVEALRRDPDGTFVAVGPAGEWRGRAVILCTGVVDHYPYFAGWEEYVGRSMFWCLTCDGYACRGERVVVVGSTDEAAVTALQLRRFTDRLTLLTNSATCAVGAQYSSRLERAGIPLVHDRIASVVGCNGRFEALLTRGGCRIALDQLFAVQGATPQSGLAAQLGVPLGAEGYIEVDAEQRTAVPGVFAAGDATRPFAHQVAAAVHQGGQAASAANYWLYPAELQEE